MGKGIIMLGMFVGSSVGSFVPMLWGGSVFSLSSILFAAVGGFLGIWGAFKFGQSF